MRDTPIEEKGEQKKGKEWPIVPGNYSLGEGDYRAVAEIRESITLPEELYIIKGKIVTPNLGVVRLVRNIVSNSNISYLILTGSTIPGFLPGQALLALKSNGVDADYQIIGAKGYQPVVKGLTKEEIEKFREDIQIIDLRGKDRSEIITRIKDLSPPDLEFSPIIKRVPTREITSHEFRTDQTIIGTLLERETFSDLWPTVLRHIWLFGNLRDLERGKVKEVLSLVSKVREPTESPYNKEFHMDESELDAYAENLLHPRAKKATYTYGNRLFNVGKLDAILEYLQENENTRRGIVSLWDPQVDVGKFDPPCSLVLNF